MVHNGPEQLMTLRNVSRWWRWGEADLYEVRITNVAGYTFLFMWLVCEAFQVSKKPKATKTWSGMVSISHWSHVALFIEEVCYYVLLMLSVCMKWVILSNPKIAFREFIDVRYTASTPLWTVGGSSHPELFHSLTNKLLIGMKWEHYWLVASVPLNILWYHQEVAICIDKTPLWVIGACHHFLLWGQNFTGCRYTNFPLYNVFFIFSDIHITASLVGRTDHIIICCRYCQTVGLKPHHHTIHWCTFLRSNILLSNLCYTAV